MRLALAIVGFVLLWGYGRRPSRTPVEVELGPGLEYRRAMVGDALTHRVVVDLARVDVRVTRPVGGVFRARPTREAAVAEGFDVAINASFFYPFHSNAPWDFGPRAGEVAEPVGGVFVDGRFFGQRDPERPMLCVHGQRAFIGERCRGWGVAGQPLVEGGRVVPDASGEPQPRTAVGIRRDGRSLVVVVVDGRQPLYSEGMSLADLATLLRDEGAYDAINLDGGGSSTLVVHGRVWNAPIHTRLPMRERPVPVHLGFSPSAEAAGP